jgi:nucleoside 2-deoxyribosyltransferase
MKKIYLAGPDVFERDALGVAKAHKKIVSDYGFEPLYPLDNDVSLDDPQASLKIYQANVDKIRDADIVVANLNPFRGHEPDSGTVWEIGFAAALGKIVIGYTSDTRTMLERVKSSEPYTVESGMTFDKDGLLIEDFSHPLNLMLMHGIDQLVNGTLEDAMKAIARLK